MNHLQNVSVIVPCRNEARFIGRCLDSIISQDYPKDRIEVLVVDGMSEDGTRTIVHGFAETHPFVKMLDNPKKITPCALNAGILGSSGELVLWMSAHNHYERSYIRKCVNASINYAAENVGGVIVPMQRNNSFMGKAIIAAISNPFGVGNSRFRVPPAEPIEVDTVFGGCYRRDVFSKIGLFNERLIRGQDMEFNLRLRRAGGRIILVPDIVSYYHARSGFLSFCRHNLANGLWAILPFAYSDIVPVSPRHLVPLFFFGAIVATLAVSFFSPVVFKLFLLGTGVYLLTAVIFSLKIVVYKKDLRYSLFMPLTFAALHLTYGAGSLWGLLKVLLSPSFWKKVAQYKWENDSLT